MKKEYIYGYETTPYAIEQTKEGFVVRQIWWDKTVSAPFKTREEAEPELERIARAAGCYKRVRFSR